MEATNDSPVDADDLRDAMERLAELIHKGDDIGELTQSGNSFRYETERGQVRMRIVGDEFRLVHYGGGMKTHQQYDIDHIRSIDVSHESFSPRYQTPLLTIRLYDEFGDEVEVAFSDANNDRRS